MLAIQGVYDGVSIKPKVQKIAKEKQRTRFALCPSLSASYQTS